MANGFRNAITGDRIADAGCTFRAVRRAALREIPVFNGMYRSLPTLLRLQGYRVVEVPVNHRPRTRGQSKYGVGSRIWRGLADCLAIRWYKSRSLRGDRCNGELGPSGLSRRIALTTMTVSVADAGRVNRPAG